MVFLTKVGIVKTNNSIYYLVFSKIVFIVYRSLRQFYSYLAWHLALLALLALPLCTPLYLSLIAYAILILISLFAVSFPLMQIFTGLLLFVPVNCKRQAPILNSYSRNSQSHIDFRFEIRLHKISPRANIDFLSYSVTEESYV